MITLKQFEHYFGGRFCKVRGYEEKLFCPSCNFRFDPSSKIMYLFAAFYAES